MKLDYLLNNKEKIFKYYAVLMCSLIILTSGSIISIRFDNIFVVPFVIMGLPTLIYVIKDKYFWTCISILALLFTINYFNYKSTTINYLYYIAKFIVIYGLLNFFKNKNINIFKILYNIIFIIVLISSINYILFDVFHLVYFTSINVNGNMYRNYLNIHYSWQQIQWHNLTIIRNNSIFWEPGVYQIYLNYSIIYMMFISKKIKMPYMLILILNLISTFSTTGLLLAVMIFFFWFIQYNIKNELRKKIRSIFILITILFCVIISIFIIKQKLGTVSYNVRSLDFLKGLALFIKRPLIGWGYLNYSIFEKITSYDGNSNGIISLLYQQGIIATVFYFYLIYNTFKSFARKFNIRTAMIFAAFFFIINLSEPFIYINFSVAFFLYGIVNRDYVYISPASGHLV